MIRKKEYCEHCKKFVLHIKYSYGWYCLECKLYKPETETG